MLLHAQRREDFARTKAIEVFARDLFESAVQKDEPYIGVFGPDAGRGDERKAKAGREEAVAIRGKFQTGGHTREGPKHAPAACGA